jgi:hypothetical protein
MVDEHNVSLELLVDNSFNQADSLNQGWLQESGNILEDLVIINHSISLTFLESRATPGISASNTLKV